jgi:putative methionine-R-sulfoxide reductase with GAF domain
MHQPADRWPTVWRLKRALARPLDEPDVLRSVYAELADTLDMSMCFFGRYDAASQSVQVVWQIHEGRELPGGHFPLGGGATSQAIREGRPRLIRCWSQNGPRVQVQYATEHNALPESSVVVPVLFDGLVVGVLSVQSYAPAAYDEDDVALLVEVADLLAAALFGRRGMEVTRVSARLSEAEVILAGMDDALLVLDADGCVVRLNRAARRLLCTPDASVVLGQRLDRPQADRWPLGDPQVSRALRPILEQLDHGAAPAEEVQLTIAGSPVRCRASILCQGATRTGAVMVLRKCA